MDQNYFLPLLKSAIELKCNIIADLSNYYLCVLTQCLIFDGRTSILVYLKMLYYIGYYTAVPLTVHGELGQST